MATLCSITSSTSSGCRSEKYAPIEYRLVSMSDSRNVSLFFFAAMCGAGYLRDRDLRYGFGARVLLLEPAARAEQRALDRRARHVHLLGDLAVRETLELAQDED